MGLLLLVSVASMPSHPPGYRMPLSAGDDCTSLVYCLKTQEGVAVSGTEISVGGKGLRTKGKTDDQGELSILVPYSSDCYGAVAFLSHTHVLILPRLCPKGALSSRLDWLVPSEPGLALCSAFAPSDTGCLVGIVTDNHGAPLSDIEVWLLGPYVRGIEKCKTDESGLYCFPGFGADSRYEIEIRVGSYCARRWHDISICPNEVTQVDVALDDCRNDEVIELK